MIHRVSLYWFLLIAITFTPYATRAAQGDAAADGAYLFCSFRGNGEDGLHLAWSNDGLKWTALNGDKSFLKPEVGSEKLMRDPCICQGPDGTFQMVWTTGWRGLDIGHASSKDLIHWTPQHAIPVMAKEPTAMNCWAPEIIWDEDNKDYLIFWSTTIPGRFPETEKAGAGMNHRIYCTTTKDFNEFSPTKLFFNPGFDVIDATIVQDGNTYRMIFKDETEAPPAKHLHTAVAGKVAGPYTEVSEPFTISWVEGPTALKVGDEWIIYYDQYTRHKYGASRTKDFQYFKNISRELSFPKDTRHGTAFRVKQDVLDKLMQEK
jgi:hypothetical protein